MQEVQAVLGVVAEDTVVAGKVERGVGRADAITVAGVVLIEATGGGMGMFLRVLFVAAAPFYEQVGRVHGGIRGTMHAAAIVKIPTGAGVISNPDVIDKDVPADGTDDATRGETVNVKVSQGEIGRGLIGADANTGVVGKGEGGVAALNPGVSPSDS